MTTNKFSIRKLALSAIGTCLLAVSASAQDHKVSDWTIGKVLSGPAVSKDDFAGKVVVIEYWGVFCPPCIASLPHLAELDKKNREKGLILIGAESQNNGMDKIGPIIKKAGVEYTITAGANGPIQVSGIPRAFVFNRSGELVYSGHPGNPEFDSSISKALKEKSSASSSSSNQSSTGYLIKKRTWTNVEGKKIVAAVKSTTDTSVQFILNNGNSVDYPLAKLSEESREAIKEIQ